MKEYKEVDFGVDVDDFLNTICYSNDEGFARIIKLYARPGDVIVDPTYGNGVFWRQVDKPQYELYLSDLKVDGIDMCSLPYASESVDMVVNDPPYRYTPEKNKKHEETHGHGKVDSLYNLQAANLKNTQAVLNLYSNGMKEAYRVLNRSVQT